MFWDLVCLPLPLWIHQAAPGWQHTQAGAQTVAGPPPHSPRPGHPPEVKSRIQFLTKRGSSTCLQGPIA